MKELINQKIIQRIDKKVWVYSIFVGIASVIWFFNKLDQNYNAIINYPVKYTNIPNNKFLTNELPKTLKLSVNAYGFTLLRYKLSPSPFPVPINLSYFYNQIRNSDNRFVLHTRYIKEDVNTEMPSNIEVLDILPDTIAFEFVDIVKRKMKILPQVKLNFEDQCMQEGEISIKPDSILVQGPVTILDTIKGIYTKLYKFKKLAKEVTKNTGLEEVDNLLFEKIKVDITIPVSKYTQAKTEVEIIPIHVPDSIKLITFPSTTTLTYMVSLGKFDKVKPSDFRIEIDYYDIQNLLGNKLPVRLKVSPTYLQSVSYFPTHVEFILEKK